MNNNNSDEQIVYGAHPVLEALRQVEPGTSGELFVERKAQSKAIGKAKRLAKDAGIKILERPASGLERLTQGRTQHQGLVLRMTAFQYAELDTILEACAQKEQPRLLLLDEVQDPHNLGALLRSAAAFGWDGVIIPTHRAAPVNATAIKVSAGTAFLIPVARVTNLARTLERLKKERFWIYGAQREAAESVATIDWARPVALVLGAEGKGLRRLTTKHCDAFVTIPQRGSGVESLNVSVAGGILMFYASQTDP